MVLTLEVGKDSRYSLRRYLKLLSRKADMQGLFISKVLYSVLVPQSIR